MATPVQDRVAIVLARFRSYGMAIAMRAGSKNAEDTLQEVELSIAGCYERATKFESLPIVAQGPFYASCVRKRVVDELRARGAAKRGGGKIPVRLGELEPANPLSTLSQVERASAIQEAEKCEVDIAKMISSLNEVDQDIVRQRYVEGRTCEEIAKKLGILPTNVRKRLERAHEKMKLYVADPVNPDRGQQPKHSPIESPKAQVQHPERSGSAKPGAN